MPACKNGPGFTSSTGPSPSGKGRCAHNEPLHAVAVGMNGHAVFKVSPRKNGSRYWKKVAASPKKTSPKRNQKSPKRNQKSPKK